ncbi:hypothetical protein Misp02_32320 [Microtetraspora sp. NBRC 16547]|nr:hypothetical protein Misp02_32320 [Microtetraspora sp. NBRC 16547]
MASPLRTVGAAAIPTALFALGMSLNTQERPDASGRTERLSLVGLKVIVQPLVAFLLGVLLLGAEREALLAPVLCSGLPSAQNTYIYAAEYQLNTDLARDAVLLSTLLSMVSLSLIVYLLS